MTQSNAEQDLSTQIGENLPYLRRYARANGLARAR